MLMFSLAKPILHRMDAERAHRLTIEALKHLPIPKTGKPDAHLGLELFGLDFPSPLGLAAGFDKDAEISGPLLALGFGFVEIGGVTPLPQPGNARPRAFRLMRDRAVINRYGLNSAGADVVRARLERRVRAAGIVGVNIGANKDSADRTQDYVALVRSLAPVADYISVNISSPNTPGLRQLQGKAELDDLLARVMEARNAGGTRCPIVVKIAPDIDLPQLDDMIGIVKARAADGLIVSNTTLARPDTLLESALAREAGGLSGPPLFQRSTVLLAQAYLRIDGAMPLIGVGGISSAEDALAKIEAGASLIQLYSALVFEGPALIGRINRGIAARIAAERLASPLALVGRKAAEWASLPTVTMAGDRR